MRVLRQDRYHRPQLVLAYSLDVLVRLVYCHLQLLAYLDGLQKFFKIVVLVLSHGHLQLLDQNFDHPIALFITCCVFEHAAGDVRQRIFGLRLR